MDEIQAAILLAKLPDLDANNQRRREIAARYEREVINDHVRILLSPRDSVYHIFPVFSPCRNELQRYLADNGVETQIHYPIPPHSQRCYKNTPLSSLSSSSLPITERIHREELSIPCNPALSDDETARIVALINRFKPAK